VNGVVRTVGLSKRFKDAMVLDHLSLEIPAGSVFGLLGPNGAGKTTTIKILMNLLEPSEGYAEVLGVDSRQLGASAFQHIGYVSENQEMPEWMTVGRLLSYLKPFYPAWDDARAAELIHRFDLPYGRKIGHLSRGMRMKAALASSLTYRPRLLVLDEPFSGLDPVIREDLVEGVLDSAGETTILISSHDLAEIETFISHVGYLDAGRMRFSEEMTSLAARFREIEVTFQPPVAPSFRDNWPLNWLRLEMTGALARFVETRFDARRTTQEINYRFGGVRDISVNPMPLRAIFVALARTKSEPYEEGCQ
jgi:ABC-2 type transport system ATP-binding protein